jgi:hypothetical protein
MTDKFRFGFLICLFLIIGVLIAGCSDESSATAATTVTPTGPAAMFTAGDIIAKTASGGETQLYVITNYDSASDEYVRKWIYKNTDGSWGHYIDEDTDRADRTIVDKVYPVTIAHVTLSAIPLVTPTYATPVPIILSGNVPTVTAISPTAGTKDGTVIVSITGTNFQTGAVPRLLQPGSSPITATGISVASTKIDCTFNLNGMETGSYNVVVTNPDGQSGTLQRAFSIGDAVPIVTSVTPLTMVINEQGGLVINGQYFKDGVKVVLIKGTAEIPCLSPVTTSGTRISCDLDLNADRNKDITFGEWDVKVINIEGSQAGTWTRKFTIQNTTSTSET